MENTENNTAENVQLERLYEWDLMNIFDDLLDECYGMVEVAGCAYDTSKLLKLSDPIRYRIDFYDWISSNGWNEDSEDSRAFVREVSND